MSGKELSKFVFAKNFEDESGFLLVFIVPGENLPGRSAERTGIFGLDAMWRGVGKFGGDGFVIMRFALGDLVVDNLFTG